MQSRHIRQTVLVLLFIGFLTGAYFLMVWWNAPAPNTNQQASVPLSTEPTPSPPTAPVPSPTPKEPPPTGKQPPPEPEPEPTRVADEPFVPTPTEVMNEMFKLARLKAGERFYDLGAGDGRIVIAAAQQYGVRAVGYEANPMLVRQARAQIAKAKLDKLVTMEERDPSGADLRTADVVFVDLGAEAVARLVPQLQKMKRGALIVCHEFGLEGFKPTTTKDIRVTDKKFSRQHQLLLYTLPLEKEPPP